MKIVFFMVMLSLSSMSIASDCLETSRSEAVELTTDVLEIASKTKYNCSNKDLNSGEYVIGAGTNVYLDKINGIVEVTTVSIHPEFKETVRDKLKRSIYQGFETNTPERNVSFVLKDDGSGVLSEKGVYLEKYYYSSYECTLEKNEEKTSIKPETNPPRSRIPGLAGDTE